MALQVGQKPVMRPSQPAMKAPAPLMASRMPSMSSLSSTVGNQTYRTLAESQDRPTSATSGQPNPARLLSNAGANSVKLPPLSEEIREQMVADINRIVKILKSSFFTGEPDSGDQTRILEMIRKYERLDDESSSTGSARTTPNLDHFLILLKSCAYSHSGIKSLFQDQYAIAYDALWYRLRGYWLEEFKRVVGKSQTQKTIGPGDRDVENGVALMAKQEAMGMWGMLKGMGTGLVGIAGPYASQWMAEQFDETARILFEHEWDASEPLVWGMNAGQIGTAGGDVIWQLVMFGRGAGPAKAGKIMAIVDSLKKIMGVGAGLQGVALGATGIARVIEARQKAGKDLSLQALIQDEDFIDQLVVVASSAIGTVMAGKGAPATKADAATRARIQLLLSKLSTTASLARLSEIAASDKTAEEKEREYGQVVTSLIPQLFSVAIDTHGLAQAKMLPNKPLSQKENEDSKKRQNVGNPPVADKNEEVIPPDGSAKKDLFGPGNSYIGETVDQSQTKTRFQSDKAPTEQLFGPRASYVGEREGVIPKNGEPGAGAVPSEPFFDKKNSWINKDIELPNEPPPRFVAPITDTEREKAQRLQNQSLGLPGKGPVEVVRWPPQKTKVPSSTQTEFTGRGINGEKITVRSTPENPVGMIVKMEITNITELPVQTRDEVLARAVKALGMGWEDWNKQLGHIHPHAAGGPEMPYNFEPMTRNYNKKHRPKAESRLIPFIKANQGKNLSLEIERTLDPETASRTTKESFVVKDAEGKPIFEIIVDDRGKLTGANAPPQKTKKSKKK